MLINFIIVCEQLEYFLCIYRFDEGEGISHMNKYKIAKVAGILPHFAPGPHRVFFSI